MEIKVSIEKKYVWLVMGVLVVVGLVVAYGTNDPQKLGHTLGEVQGVAPNCVEKSQSWYCQQVDPKLWAPSDTANVAAEAWDSLRLGTVAADQFCRKDGTNCPPTSQGLAYKRASTEQCGGTAFFCLPVVVGSQVNYNALLLPVWNDYFKEWYSQGGSGKCRWVLCTQ